MIRVESVDELEAAFEAARARRNEGLMVKDPRSSYSPGRRGLGWLATVSRWSVERHEVEITLERDVVTDVQARVRRSPLTPAATS